MLAKAYLDYIRISAIKQHTKNDKYHLNERRGNMSSGLIIALIVTGGIILASIGFIFMYKVYKKL